MPQFNYQRPLVVGKSEKMQSVRLLTSKDTFLLRGQGTLISSLTILVGYLLFGHWGVVVPAVFWLLVGVGNILNYINRETAVLPDDEPDVTAN